MVVTAGDTALQGAPAPLVTAVAALAAGVKGTHALTAAAPHAGQTRRVETAAALTVPPAVAQAAAPAAAAAQWPEGVAVPAQMRLRVAGFGTSGAAGRTGRTGMSVVAGKTGMTGAAVTTGFGTTGAAGTTGTTEAWIAGIGRGIQGVTSLAGVATVAGAVAILRTGGAGFGVGVAAGLTAATIRRTTVTVMRVEGTGGWDPQCLVAVLAGWLVVSGVCAYFCGSTAPLCASHLMYGAVQAPMHTCLPARALPSLFCRCCALQARRR